jgi:DNA mismatch endonuclease, patch repair protein
MLHAAGLRFRLHRKLAVGCTPDFVLPRYQIAVFVDGCFWHACPEHGRSTWSGPNAELWQAKMNRNMERDRRSTSIARTLGWRVIRVWEHEVVADPSKAAMRVLSAARSDQDKAESSPAGIDGERISSHGR